MAREDYRESVPLKLLDLDPQNPRLPREGGWESKSETQILRVFVRRYNLIELARSMADKGFAPRHAEALLAVEGSDGRFTVVEGNRRLATVKLLSGSADRHEAGAQSTAWEELVAQASRHQLGSVPVIVYPDRGSLDGYLGFRHITGPTPWRPEAKARFIAKLLGGGGTVGDVARGIGSNHRTVRRYAEAHAVYTQAAEAGIPVDQVERGFGIFYNALDRQNIREHLGLKRQSEINSLPRDPVPAERLSDLRDVLGLLYGDDDRSLDKVIRESRDLAKLDDVFGDAGALARLLAERDLDRVWREGGGGRNELLATLAGLRSRIAEVAGLSPEFGTDQGIQGEVKRVYDLAVNMARQYEVEEP